MMYSDRKQINSYPHIPEDRGREGMWGMYFKNA